MGVPMARRNGLVGHEFSVLDCPAAEQEPMSAAALRRQVRPHVHSAVAEVEASLHALPTGACELRAG
jgi:hypothetical protein